jgi:hypothetical protein
MICGASNAETKKRSSGRLITVPEEKRTSHEADLFPFTTVVCMIYQTSLLRNGHVFFAISEDPVAMTREYPRSG